MHYIGLIINFRQISLHELLWVMFVELTFNKLEATPTQSTEAKNEPGATSIHLKHDFQHSPHSQTLECTKAFIGLKTSWGNIFFCHLLSLSFPNPVLLCNFHKESRNWEFIAIVVILHLECL